MVMIEISVIILVIVFLLSQVKCVCDNNILGSGHRYRVISAQDFSTISIINCHYFSGNTREYSCGQTCNKELSCVYYAINSNGQCFICMLHHEAPVMFYDWPFSLEYKNITEIFVKDAPLCLGVIGGQFGSLSGESYWIFTRNEWGAFGNERNTYISLIVYTLTLEFRTSHMNGIIMFIERGGSEVTYDDFVAIYIENGYIKHSADNYYGKGIAATVNKYNDGMWHRASFYKNNDYLETIVDGVKSTGNIVSSGGSTDVAKTFKIGGIPSNLDTKAQKHIVS